MSYFVSVARFLFWSLILGISAGGLVTSSFYLYLTPNLPAAEQLKQTQLQVPLRIYTNDGLLVAEFGEKRRTPITIEAVPLQLKQAFIAAEDNRFYAHQGVDLKGLLRASIELVTTGHIQSGGSTITMQVAKNFFFSREKTFTRKFNEILLALQIEQELSKDEILELYFNKIYLGNRAYGIEAAAKVYYGASTKDLSLAQMAMIAGLPKAPSKYNPIANPSRALIRRDWILKRMNELDLITDLEYQQAVEQPITASYHGTNPEVDAPYLAEMTRKAMIKEHGETAYEDGYEVTLTIHSKDQIAANEALRRGLEEYDRRHGYKGPLAKFPTELFEDIPTVISKLKSANKSPSFITAVVTALDDNTKSATTLTEDQSVAVISWENMNWARKFITTDSKGPSPKTPSDILSIGDVVYIQNISKKEPEWMLTQVPEAQSALISLAPNNGAIKALVGGYNFYQSKYNRVIQSKRQPGSNFKPFIYLAALENGFTAASLINDAPIVFDDKNLESTWRPENSSGRFYGPTRLRQALYNSRNLVSIRLLQSTGINRTLDYVEKFGFDRKDLPRDLSLALGSAGVSPWDLARGYAILANGGYKISPYFISSIKDAKGNIVFAANPATGCYNCPKETENAEATVYEASINNEVTATEIAETTATHEPTPTQAQPVYAERAIDERAAYIMHSILKDVIRKGTGQKAKALNRSDLAGKTGTTNDQRDAWFSGFNGDIATTVWVGFDQPDTLGRREYGAAAALPIWIDYMAIALAGTPEKQMPQPEGIVTVRINPETGLRAGPDDKSAIFEIFRADNIPEASVSTSTNNKNGAGDITNTSTLPEDIF